MKINVQTDEDTVIALDAVEGWSVMEILRDHGMPIKAECGGACCCATCHVYIDNSWSGRLPDMGPEEEDMLGMAPDVHENSRLSCQLVMDEDLDGLTLKIAPSS